MYILYYDYKDKLAWEIVKVEKFEYITEISPNGYLPVPDDIIKKINTDSHTKLHISIFPMEIKKKKLSWFTGKWQDNKTADEIVDMIYSDRNQNIQSQKINL